MVLVVLVVMETGILLHTRYVGSLVIPVRAWRSGAYHYGVLKQTPLPALPMVSGTLLLPGAHSLDPFHSPPLLAAPKYIYKRDGGLSSTPVVLAGASFIFPYLPPILL